MVFLTSDPAVRGIGVIRVCKATKHADLLLVMAALATFLASLHYHFPGMLDVAGKPKNAHSIANPARFLQRRC